MKRTGLVALGMLLASGAALAQLPAKPTPPAPVAATGPAPHATPAKPVAASTPESRSAAALALSAEPTFDEGTAQRIKEAALSYGDLAVRGGWPAIPTEAKFAAGAPGPHDELLR